MLFRSNWKDATGTRLVYLKIANNLREAGYSRSLEQCRDKIKKLKGEYKKVRDKRENR